MPITINRDLTLAGTGNQAVLAAIPVMGADLGVLARPIGMEPRPD